MLALEKTPYYSSLPEAFVSGNHNVGDAPAAGGRQHLQKAPRVLRDFSHDTCKTDMMHG
jgi:hypothetical protein